ncbi:MAG TPA: hypothetical protein VF557_14755 [Jatrophihabitans sp.]|jgi:hypothetical protein|uniref:hypothetical protein n=1 Tax=Jatrophihabitans sp. TaxID=1932789 RepID=UPI002EE3242B
MTGVAVLASGCTRLPCPGQQVEAFDLGDANPLKWLGTAASAAAGDAWLTSMTGLWSAALWLLKLAFQIIDAFTTPDLSATGPMGSVLPTTLWLGATLAVIMMFVQLSVALIRRDGESIGRVLIGIAQFGLVWVAYLGLAAGFVAAASGLERGILEQMLQVQELSQVDLSASFPDKITDITLATVLGVLGLFIVIPAAFFYVLIMFVREAALIILVATAPISAGGLVSEIGKVWFWKTLRWFFSCLLISPMAALVLGVGVTLSTGVIDAPKPLMCGGTLCDPLDAQQVSDFANATNTAHAGMAVVGCIVIAIGACCPMILFRLLAFVEPGTASGAALRQSWSNAGGMSGIIGGGAQSAGSSAATQGSGDGRSGGESGAEAQTQTRLSSALGAFGTGMQVATSFAYKAADLSSDILGQAGVGSPGYSMTPTDERSSRSSDRGRSSSNGSSDPSSGPGGAGGESGGGSMPEPPTPPMPGGGARPGGGAGGAGAAGGSEAAAAVVAL